MGDKKDFKGRTYFFCDCPFHRNRMRWHTHPTDKCRTRARWLKKKEDGNLNTQDDNSASAHISEENEAYDSTAGDATSNDSIATASSLSSNPTDIQALLASAMNLVQDNDVLRDHIVDAINVISDI